MAPFPHPPWGASVQHGKVIAYSVESSTLKDNPMILLSIVIC